MDVINRVVGNPTKLSFEEDPDSFFPFKQKNDQNHVSGTKKYDPNEKPNNIYKLSLLLNVCLDTTNDKPNKFEDDYEQVFLMVTTRVEEAIANLWHLDTGCFTHMTGHRN